MRAPETPVRAVMTAPAVTVDGQTTAAEAARRMTGQGIGSVIVHGLYDDGILTKTDLVVGLGNGVGPDVTPVTTLMSSPAITVSTDVTLCEAVAAMADHGVKRLPVEDDGEVVGIVTTTDLVAELSPGADTVVDALVDLD